MLHAKATRVCKTPLLYNTALHRDSGQEQGDKDTNNNAYEGLDIKWHSDGDRYGVLVISVLTLQDDYILPGV